jgi:hypothetical protein
MSTHAYTEEQLVEQPAIGLFAELGWQTVSASDEIFGATGTLQRETKGEVVLVSRLRAALERLNAGRMGHHALPPEAITAAVDELTRDRSAMSRFSEAGEVGGRRNISPELRISPSGEMQQMTEISYCQISLDKAVSPRDEND